MLCVLFFCSGLPALIYQLTWQRALFRIFGVNIELVTIVVTAFMLGLGIGSLAGGYLSKQRSIPLLRLLAVIELLTGAFGLVSLKIFDWVGEFTVGLPLPAIAAVSLALVIVPTLLMGATLPVLVAHLVRHSGKVGSALGLLYYVNTLALVQPALSAPCYCFRSPACRVRCMPPSRSMRPSPRAPLSPIGVITATCWRGTRHSRYPIPRSLC